MIQLIHGDCLEELKKIPSGIVDAVVTDPPYGVDAASWDNRVPYELISEFLRVAKGPIVWFGSASHVISDAKSFPIEPDRMMIWAPKFTLSKCAKDGFAYRFHPIWIWRPRKQKSVPWDVFTDSTECGNWWKHGCTKPIRLMRRLVQSFSFQNTIVLDPFMGSGTTGVACVQTGRNFIGIEIDKGYFDIAKKRIEAAKRLPEGGFFMGER